MIYDKGLLQELDILKADMVDNEQDLVISVWGREGSGKSKVALNLAVYLDHTFNADNIHTRLAQTFTDYARIFPDIQPMQAGVWDEAHRFGRRGQSDTRLNRTMLEYLQDIRGAKKIHIYCYPEIQEIDRKMIQRSRLFFETVKHGRSFTVRGWTREQVEVMIRLLELSNRNSRWEAWIGLSRDPKRVFRCDYKDFPLETYPDVPSFKAVIMEYKKMKEGSIRRSEELMRSHGYFVPLDIAKELIRRTDVDWGWAEKTGRQIIAQALKEEWVTEEVIELKKDEYRIKKKEAFDIFVSMALAKIQDKTLIKIPMNDILCMDKYNIPKDLNKKPIKEGNILDAIIAT